MGLRVSIKQQIQLVKKAVKICNGQAKLGLKLAKFNNSKKYSQSTISTWIGEKGALTIEDMIAIQLATDGLVKVEDFIPGLHYKGKAEKKNQPRDLFKEDIIKIAENIELQNDQLNRLSKSISEQKTKLSQIASFF